MSDNYLIHWGKGKEAKSHKYTARKWVNGAWQYVYGTLGGNAKKKYQDAQNRYSKAQTNYDNAQHRYNVENAKLRVAEAKAQKSDAYRKARDEEFAKADFIKDWKYTVDSDGYIITGKERSKQHKMEGLKYGHIANTNDANYKNIVESNKVGTAKVARNVAYSAKNNAEIYRNNTYAAYTKTPLYKMETAISKGKSFLDKLFKRR